MTGILFSSHLKIQRKGNFKYQICGQCSPEVSILLINRGLDLACDKLE
jgi:hypothetical protein